MYCLLNPEKAIIQQVQEWAIQEWNNFFAD
jgi:hypothetical protein